MVSNVNSNYRTHVVTKNESLWRIAKKELGKNATENKIANYVNKMVKLNKIKNPNTIFVNDKLYLPVQQQNAAASSTNQQAVTNVTTKTKSPQKANSTPTIIKRREVAQVTSKVKQPLTNAEKGFKNFKDKITGHELLIEKAYLGDAISSELYHINILDGKSSNKLNGTYTKDKNGKFKSFLFNGVNKINPYGYDYVLYSNGNIYKQHDIDIHGINNSIVQGKISKSDLQKLITTIEKLLPKKK